jgi:DNA-binding HxlR family transcriptional regulator
MSMDQNNKLSEDVNNAIKMIGDDHILCIIGNLRDGGMRFNELQRAINVNPSTLTDRLSKLESDGFVIKKKETLDKMSVVYSLTEKGKEILPVITEIAKFAKKHL